MTAARIIIWRHGRNEWNVVDRFQGQADIPLDEVGRGQAIRAAEVLAAYRPTRLYSSDLTRCYQTAVALAERTGHTPNAVATATAALTTEGIIERTRSGRFRLPRR